MSEHDLNDPALRSFIDAGPENHFPIQNLPLGLFSTRSDPRPRVGVAIGEQVLDLPVLHAASLLDGVPGKDALLEPDLNSFLALGRPSWRALRRRISELLRHDNATLRDDAPLRERALHAVTHISNHMPMQVRGFSDFFLSEEHARNCLDIVGAAKEGFWPNWHHFPMGYNSRASSVMVSGTPVRRPWGQLKSAQGEIVHGICRQLDFELETALVVGKPNTLGSPISLADAQEHAHGVVLLNDWSARDIQQWEAQPLGVFNSKNFLTSISPWLVSLDALEPFRVDGPRQDPLPLEYLRQPEPRNYAIHLEASIRPEGGPASTVCRSSLREMYWSFAQQLVHQTSAGCNVLPGDLLATGTVSNRAPGALGCLFEVTRDGKQRFDLEHGGTRLYLDDGDEVSLTGWCQGQGYRVGFGECTGRVSAAASKATTTDS